MKIIIDAKIPFIRDAIAAVCDCPVYIDGSAITAEAVRDADALVVRTRTRVDRALLEGSSVSFVATATIGYDHLDTDYLRQAGIAWTNCPGCNASSVAQYVRACLLLLANDFRLDLAETVIGVVGHGHVGNRVAALARQLGMTVLVCDPPLHLPDGVTLDVIAQRADIISFHVPLTRNGSCPTFHLADKAFFRSLRNHPFIINTSRGDVIDEDTLLSTLRDGTIRQAVIDTWANEPFINTDLLHTVYIGTPHIAGYSADGKVNADNMVISALCRHFALPVPPAITPPPLPRGFVFTGNPLELYDPRRDSNALKAHPELFEWFRGHYPLRRESV